MRPPDGRFRLVTTQQHLNELAGCEEVDGQLFIDAPEGTLLDLSPLASLRRVGGDLVIGCNPYLGGGDQRDCGESAQRSLSLEGLEKLEVVEGSLSLGGLPVTSLAPLGNLSTVGGRFTIVNCNSLTSLEGLGGAAVRSLRLQQNAQLSSLSGLRLAADADWIFIHSMPALTDVSALAQLRSVADLGLEEVPLQNLDALRGLTHLGSLGLVQMPRLTDISGVSQIRKLDRLYLLGTALENLDDLRLESLGELNLTDNDQLVEVDALGAVADLVELRVSDHEQLVRLPAFPNVTGIQSVHMYSNAALREGPSFPNVERMPNGSIFIAGNPNLLRIDGFARIEEIHQISIRGNEQLVAIDFGQLTSAESLHVTCNLELPDMSLAPLLEVSTRDLLLEGNQGSEALCQPLL